jgi:hypothetical protein
MRKDLIQKLSILKDIKPDSSWKENNRNLLLLQVKSSGSQTEIHSGFFGFMKNTIPYAWLQGLPHAVVVSIMLVLVFLGSGVFSLHASKDSKPGDTFYIAKRLNEKAQLAVAFNDEQKARLGLEFAGNRVKELKAVLSEPVSEQNQADVVKLVDDFKEKIKIAKTGLPNATKPAENKEAVPAAVKPIVKETVPKVVSKKEANSTEKESGVFSAGLKKESKGIQVSTPEDTQTEEVKEEIKATSSPKKETEAEAELSKNIDELMIQTENLLKTIDGVDASALDALEAKVVEVSGGGAEATSTEKGE